MTIGHQELSTDSHAEAPRLLPVAVAAVASFGAGLALAIGLVGAAHPDVIFPKYLVAATAAAGEQAERLLDYSPLYLAFVRLSLRWLRWGPAGILVAQAVLHGFTAAVAAIGGALAIGRRAASGGAGAAKVGASQGLTAPVVARPALGATAGEAAAAAGAGRPALAAWVAGLGVAAYRPFLVYSGIHEPETLLLLCLAVAMTAGLAARRFIAGGEGGAGSGMQPAAPAPLPSPSPSQAPSSVRTVALVAAAFVALAAAALGRPQFVVLIPVWGLWLGAAAPRGSRAAAHRRVWLAAAVASAVVLGPPVWARARATGVPTIMNPGAVFYEGNGPGATGLTRYAPAAVIDLERAHREAYDYGHVAYRRIAVEALHLEDGAARRPQPSVGGGAQLSVAGVNRYWTALAWEEMAAQPDLALRRFGRKALMALMPYEGHDLIIAERLDRRLRGWLPWGFSLPLAALAWLALARGTRWQQLAGPLALVVLAGAVQVAVYASARQRLPLALALWMVLPALLADALRGELRVPVRPALAVLTGLGLAFGLAAATSRIATLDQVGWDGLLGSRPSGAGEAAAAILEGRAFRSQMRQDAERLAAGTELTRHGQAAAALAVLAPLVGRGEDLTSDDRKVGVAEYWAALDLLALGDRRQAATAARAAESVRPDDPRLAALGRQLAAPPEDRAAALRVAWRPPGCDPVTARVLEAGAAAADHDRAAFLAALAPLRDALPELAPSGHPPR